jgi:hypothetical protein
MSKKSKAALITLLGKAVVDDSVLTKLEKDRTKAAKRLARGLGQEELDLLDKDETYTHLREFSKRLKIKYEGSNKRS